MLRDCGLSKDVVADIKRGSEPNARNMSVIAKYFNVSIEYLLGDTDNPTPPKKSEDMTPEERLAAEMLKMSPEKKRQLEIYAKFLKTQEDLAQGFADISNSNLLRPQQ